MPWVESYSQAFSARHDSSQSGEANTVLSSLEVFRDELAGLFPELPEEIAVVLHPRSAALTLAHPWLPLARRVSAPAGPPLLRRLVHGDRRSTCSHHPRSSGRASNVEGSREALLLSPLHEYAHVVLGANSDELPPPFSVAAFRRYVRWAWLCEGAATWLSGQTPHLRAAIVRRLREGRRPEFPPAPADAMLLGGTIFEMLEREAGARAAAGLATGPLDRGARSLLVDAFGRQLAAIERDWREELDSLSAA